MTKQSKQVKFMTKTRQTNKSTKQNKKAQTKQAQTKAMTKTQKKQKLKELKQLVKNWFCYTYKIDSDTKELKITKEQITKQDFDLYIKLLDEFKQWQPRQDKKVIVKKSILYKQDIIDNASIKWLDFYELKLYKQDINNQIEKLTIKKQTLDNDNLKLLIDRKIKKLFFYLSTYTQQLFDLYYTSDTLTKYNFDLLHYDLFLKSENLNNQLLYYRLIDTKTRCQDFDTYILDSDFVKTQTYDKTQSSIIDKITNQIILDTIAQNDSLKLEYIKIYHKNLYKQNKQKQAMTITRYKKYLIDRYNYLFSDTIKH